ncbi:MAG: cation:proton antiporter, partial [Myxococcota bacterium]
LSQLRREHDLPVRLLALGMPLTVLLGAGLAVLILPELGWLEAAVLAAVLAPTDAALGQAVVSHEKVPVRIRQALNVESGLNDGVALPGVLILSCAASAVHSDQTASYWVLFTLKQVTLGPLAGLLVGFLGGKMVDGAITRGTITHGFRDLSVIALALLSFSLAELVGGNGFIAAFVGGLTLGSVARDQCRGLFEFSESEGQLLTIATFALFGALMVPEAWEHLDGAVLAYALVSLTAARMLPVTLSLLGKKLRRSTHLFLGWFGPRGLASILFALLVVQEADLPHEALVVTAAVVTVVLSTFLHGMTAFPLSNLYGARLENDGAEHVPVSEMPVRVPLGRAPDAET